MLNARGLQFRFVFDIAAIGSWTCASSLELEEEKKKFFHFALNTNRIEKGRKVETFIYLSCSHRYFSVE